MTGHTTCNEPIMLHTDRLTLRRFRTEDAPAIHVAMSDPEVMHYWSTATHANLARTEEWVARTIAATEAGESDEFVIEHRREIVGKVGLWRGDEIGFLMMRHAWGHGFAAEAARAVIGRGLERGLARITAEVDPLNERSLRLLKGLGFRRTGHAARTFCINGVWSDSVYLELRRPATADERQA